jgi:hypothetical protein
MSTISSGIAIVASLSAALGSFFMRDGTCLSYLIMISGVTASVAATVALVSSERKARRLKAQLQQMKSATDLFHWGSST